MRRSRWSRPLILLLAALSALGALTAPAARAQPAECGTALDGPPSTYLGAWVPAARDNPGLPLDQDPLGQFNALAGKRISVLTRWEHWGLGPEGGPISAEWLSSVARAG